MLTPPFCVPERDLRDLDALRFDGKREFRQASDSSSVRTLPVRTASPRVLARTRQSTLTSPRLGRAMSRVPPSIDVEAFEFKRDAALLVVGSDSCG